jgi:Bacterial SCP ortholog
VRDALSAEPRRPAQTRLLVKHYLAVLAERAPGASVEVRVPPYAAVQAVPGVRHTRGTPPAVVEVDAETWIGLATGALEWATAERDGRVRASGERADLSGLLPLENRA